MTDDHESLVDDDEESPSHSDLFLGEIYDTVGLFGVYVLIGVVVAVLFGLVWFLISF
jgi:hypothetical protein